MNNEFIPREQAMEMKALGFDEPCLTSYGIDYELMSIWKVEDEFTPSIKLKDEPIGSYVQNSVHFHLSNWCAAPLWQQAFRWFGDKHDMLSKVLFRRIPNTIYVYIISCEKNQNIGLYAHTEVYQTYEEAQLACLKELIQTLKEKQNN